MFGRRKTGDEDLRANHREYYRNCLVQIADLEDRTSPAQWSSLKGNFAAVWSDDATAYEISEKVSLARNFASGLEAKLSSTSVEAAAKALELLQEIIDNAERQLQGLLAGLVAAQVMRSTDQ